MVYGKIFCMVFDNFFPYIAMDGNALFASCMFLAYQGSQV